MQPYFVPYAGYFRLMAAADVFVIYDCVQFPRRGWVHRNRLPDAHGRLQWLTLPLAHAPQDVRIDALSFRADARDALQAQLRRFPALASPAFAASPWHGALLDLPATPLDLLERSLALACHQLGLPCRMLRSSRLQLPASLRGQDRILAIAKALGATRYINAPGGTALYCADDFAAHGVALEFLPPWAGDSASILQRLLAEPAHQVAEEIRSQCGHATHAEEMEWTAS